MGSPAVSVRMSTILPGRAFATGQPVENLFDQVDVISSGVGAGVAGAQQFSEGLPTTWATMVDERQQGVESVPFLVGGFRVLLLTMCSNQGGIDVDDQRVAGVGSVIRSVLAGKVPYPCPSSSPSRVDRGQTLIDVSGQELKGPGDRRVRCHTPVQVGFGPEFAAVGQDVTAEGEGEREIKQNLARVVSREGLLPRCQGGRQVVGEAAGVHGFREQDAVGAVEGVAGSGINVQTKLGAGRLHPERAPC